MTASAARIAVLNSHPIQYFAPLYAYLCRDPDLEVTAIYCSDFSMRHGLDPGFQQPITWDIDLLEGYKSVFAGPRSRVRTPAGFFSLVCPEVWGEIRSGKYDALWLHGYAYAADVIAFLAAKSCGMPVFMRSETHLGLSRAPLRRRIRDAVLSEAYRLVDAFLAIGSLNEAYYRSLGVPARRIFRVPYTVDNERFVRQAGEAAAQRSAIRREFGLGDDEVVVLYASKLTRRKRADDLVKAMAVLRDRGIGNAALLVVGSGEMQAELEALAGSLRLDRVLFAGFVNQARLPRVLASVDAFVLPSEAEPWGLIVNEAMCAGLPVVVSDQVGASKDLVSDGENGFVVPVGEVEGIARALAILATDSERRGAMGQASLRRIASWNYEQCRQGLKEALSSVELRGNVRAPG